MSEAASIVVRVPLAFRGRPGRKAIVTPHGVVGTAPTRTRADPALVKALARGHRWKRILEKGRYATVLQGSAVGTH
jgi:hypothetical protein